MCAAFSSGSFIATVLYIRNKKKDSLICYLKYYVVFHRATCWFSIRTLKFKYYICLFPQELITFEQVTSSQTISCTSGIKMKGAMSQ